MKKWQEVVIGLLLIAVTFFATRYYRNEQILNLQNEYQTQVNGIEKTRQIIQGAINNGTQIDFQKLADVGWVFTAPVKPAATQPDGSPSK